MNSPLRNQKGFALVVVILIISILVATVTDFAYSVYNETVSLYNWRDLQKLSLEAASGITVGEKYLRTYLSRFNFSYPGRFDLPVPDVAGDGRDSMVVTIVDESGKLNINKIVNPNQTPNTDINNRFKRLLAILDIHDTTLPDRIVDWIDKDSEERVRDSEVGAKNDYLYSIDELRHIPGITDEIYKKLLPHVTIFGDGKVNINSADQYVLMCLHADITEDLAKRIISYRDLKPFTDWSQLSKIAGMEGIYASTEFSPSMRISVQGSAFSIIVTAIEENLKRTITTVVENKGQGTKLVYKYWKET
jgi:general secretion pathway protein K